MVSLARYLTVGVFVASILGKICFATEPIHGEKAALIRVINKLNLNAGEIISGIVLNQSVVRSRKHIVAHDVVDDSVTENTYLVTLADPENEKYRTVVVTDKTSEQGSDTILEEPNL